ncbi:tripartite tricarboxylate transporter TctB family protein [Salibacterium aidingense]|uniref:tripartite tricarboxylate transporter TctB family protein n=1 Tax=Salibacterium aidingense TaxID=384933 RepID=UPI003BD7DAE0
MTKNDKYIGAFIILLGLYMFIQTFWTSYPNFPNEPGPVLMPKVIGGGLFLCGLGLLLWPKKKEKKEEIYSKEEIVYIQEGSLKRMFIIAGAFICYVAILNIIGFIISTIVFLAFSIWFLNPIKTKQTFIIATTTAIGMSIIVNFSFSKLLNIRLPDGLF